MKRNLICLVLLLPLTVVQAQWVRSYPAAEGYDHQIYLEGYELPIMAIGAMDPAPSPDGSVIAFSARGWLWLLDPGSGIARRLTRSGGIDSRPEWAPDGRRLVFVRDRQSHFEIVEIDGDSGVERTLVDTPTINLDPVYSDDGGWVYYSSAEGGAFELWRVSLESLEREAVTVSFEIKKRPIKRRPLLLNSGEQIVYLNKQNYYDSIELYETAIDESATLLEDWVTSQSDLTLSPDGRHLVYTWPNENNGHEIRMMALNDNSTSVLLTRSQGLPLSPQFSYDGQWIYFSEADDDELHRLKRISVAGGDVEQVEISSWDWGVPTGTLKVTTLVNRKPGPVRISIVDEAGHPLLPDAGIVHSEGQHKRNFFYSAGEITITAPAGEVTVAAVHGFETREVIGKATIVANEAAALNLNLFRIWNASENGWYAGDNHFHLNYGGHYRLEPEDILLELQAESMDFGYALLANLHNRFFDQDRIDQRYSEGPIIEFGLEPRAHLLGHLNLLGIDELFWPWVWGPAYQVHGQDDRLNATALRFARERGGLGGYVHPIFNDDPFADANLGSAPGAFVADAVLGEVDLFEIACLWSWEIGTAAMWHAILNLGIPLAASAGSDAMNDLYRTFPTGSSRVYVRPEGELTTASYLEALKNGNSFVTTGPMLEFTVEGAGPGSVVDSDSHDVRWALQVHSALPYESVQIFINGEAAIEFSGNDQPGSRGFGGLLTIPHGGWVTARVLGENTGWPVMDSYVFAETSPIWFGEVGSTDPFARRQSAAKLLRVLEASRQALQGGYGDTPIPVLMQHFDKARARLEVLAEE